MTTEELREALKFDWALKNIWRIQIRKSTTPFLKIKKVYFIISCKYLGVSRFGYLKCLKNGKPMNKNFNRFLTVKLYLFLFI
ncbi:hypothetical protein [Spiroplasma tabanidicola]|uniref:hypothetical protein n=1 Tax=Spiroplasma tabanidicola TaxID=324079 RepID=UPI00147827D7|nr:hypothetical protein [Spiroplasma tabanidicola]